MKTLLLSICTEATGNKTTITRIQSFLEDAGHETVVIDPTSIQNFQELQSIITEQNIQGAIGLHGFHAGKWLRKSNIPYAIIYGNTDLNIFTQDAENLTIMSEAAQNAEKLIAFNNDFIKQLEIFWSKQSHKIVKIPQSVVTHPSAYSLKKEMCFAEQDLVFLLPSGLRELKDPLFIVEAFSKWHTQNPHVHLVLIGQARDKVYAKQCAEAVSQLAGVHIHEPIPQSNLHAAMQESTAIINSSKYESMPNAILEAMELGTPVLARDIPGNSHVEHKKTGLKFTTPEECIAYAKLLVDDITQRDDLTNNASTYVQKDHAPTQEALAYTEIVAMLSL